MTGFLPMRMLLTVQQKTLRENAWKSYAGGTASASHRTQLARTVKHISPDGLLIFHCRMEPLMSSSLTVQHPAWYLGSKGYAFDMQH